MKIPPFYKNYGIVKFTDVYRSIKSYIMDFRLVTKSLKKIKLLINMA